MDARDLLLQQHARAHTAAVAGDKGSVAERAFGALGDEQMRVRPREDLNSLVWLMWHIARAEDLMVNPVLAGRDQVLDAGWLSRLRITRRDFGFGMTSAEVSALSEQVDVSALRDYRDAVGRRTRDILGGFGPTDLEGAVTAEGMQRAAAEGAFGDRQEQMLTMFTGRPRLGVFSGMAVMHSMQHFGEAFTVRSAGGFGPGT
jgi:hypothetical protein